MSKGRVTIPTDENFVEETKRIAEIWGADAVRDCDGTELPKNAKEIAEKVYKTYFLARGDNDFAYTHDELMQSIALISDTYLATEKELKIDPLKGYFRQQSAINETNPKKYWQVIDRTSGKEWTDWEYDSKEKVVIIHNAAYMHEYTVSFFANNLWDATQIYNYTCNGWTITKDRDIDPVFPEALAKIKENLEKWLIENPDINVLRFTTFFYHFFLMHTEEVSKQKYFDWFGYAMSASPAMFDLFEKEKGYALKIEDIVDGGYYANHFRSPSKRYYEYMEFVEKFIATTMKEIIDIVHKYGREAMMFLGDNWIGGELHGKYFKEMGLDAVVGSVNSGVTLRMLAEIPHVKYREARFLPYFFPDTIPDDEVATNALNLYWAQARRPMMRKPVDRIGFGGYLQLASKLPNFMDSIAHLCQEYRDIYDAVDNKVPYTSVKVAILNEWGKKRTWMNHMVCQDAPYQKMYKYQGVLEALCGLPVQVDFINFEDVKNGKLAEYDVVMNYGDRDTAFVGTTAWTDEEVITAVRKYIYEGGGFIGMGQPTSAMRSGKFFQLAEALGVDEELSFSMSNYKWNFEPVDSHFITADVNGEIDYGGDLDNIYALEGAKILDIAKDRYFGVRVSAGHVRMACNEYGKGRTFYMTGMLYNPENTRLLYRALLWTAKKEDSLEKAYSTNIHTECHFYPNSGKYAVVNNSGEEQTTTFFDVDGKATKLTLKPLDIAWL